MTLINPYILFPSGGGGPAPEDIDTWAKTGNIFSSLEAAVGGDDAMAALSSTRIVIFQDTGTTLTTYDWNGTSWSKTGNSFTVTGVNPNGTIIIKLTATRIAMVDSGSDTIRAFDFNGTNWSATGSAFSLTAGAYVACGLTTTDIVVGQSATSTFQTYRFNGSTWSTVGSAFAFGTISTNQDIMVKLSSTRILYIDAGNLEAYSFNGSTWSSLGNQLNSGNGIYRDAAYVSDNVFVAWGGVNGGLDNNHRLSKWSFDGTDFAQDARIPLLIFDVQGAGTKIAALDSTTVACISRLTSNLFTLVEDTISVVRQGIQDSSVVCHCDATLSSSYNGTSQTIANLEATPADGSTQTALDFWLGGDASVTSDDPTFFGAAGSPLAYFETDSGDIFTCKSSGAAAAFFRDFHKTTQQWWFAYYGDLVLVNNDGFCGTSNTNTLHGMAIEMNADGTADVVQRDGVGSTTVTSASTAILQNDTKIIIVSGDNSLTTGNLRFWSNSPTKIEQTNMALVTDTTDSTGIMRILGVDNGDGGGNNRRLSNGNQCGAFAFGNTFLNDGATVNAIFDQLLKNCNGVLAE